MQPIERYGVAALLFLIATIGAVVLWDQTESGDGDLPKDTVAAAEKAAGKKAPKKAPANTHTPPRELANNLLAAIDGRKPAANNGRINLGGKQGQNGNPGKGGQQAGGAANTNNDSWARGTKAPLTIPMGNPKGKAAKPESKATMTSAEAEIANRTNPSAKNMATAGLIDLGVDKQRKPVGARNTKQSKGRTYKVASGDTLGGIAVSELGGYSKLGALLKANPGMTAESALVVGKVLRIPDVGQAAATTNALFQNTAKAGVANAAAKGARSYTVQEGDSLWKIASNELGDGMRHAEIKKLNASLASDTLSVGMVLTLPGGKSSPVAQTPKPATTTTKPRFKPGVVR